MYAYIFPPILSPLNNISLCCSIYTTIGIAWERQATKHSTNSQLKKKRIPAQPQVRLYFDMKITLHTQTTQHHQELFYSSGEMIREGKLHPLSQTISDNQTILDNKHRLQGVSIKTFVVTCKPFNIFTNSFFLLKSQIHAQMINTEPILYDFRQLRYPQNKMRLL